MPSRVSAARTSGRYHRRLRGVPPSRGSELSPGRLGKTGQPGRRLDAHRVVEVGDELVLPDDEGDLDELEVVVRGAQDGPHLVGDHRVEVQVVDGPQQGSLELVPAE